MNDLPERSIRCPYCGEMIVVLIDHSIPQQAYIEDCQVCCRPINFSVAVLADDDIEIRVATDSE